MKWFSVKKYAPVLVCSLTLVRVKKKEYVFFDLAEYDHGWKDWVNKEPIEEDGYIVTHFMIPDPVEIEE